MRLLYIAGSGRSGSTLLDLLLGNHPMISGLGEIHRLSLEPETRKCSCNRTIQDCPYWSRVIRAYTSKLGVPIREWYRYAPVGVRRTRTGVRRILPSLMDVAVVVGSHRMVRLVSQVPGMNRKMAVAVRNSWTLFEAVAETDGTSVVVDSTKNPVRLKLLYMTGPDRFQTIHLVRDGRAVAASAMRRTGVGMREAARQWVRANRNVEWVLRSIPAAQKLRVRYEDLCDDTENVLRRICGFIGLDYVPEMIQLKRRTYHQVPGNPMLFDRAHTVIQKDERWRQQLSARDRSEFARIGGEMNRAYGYCDG